MSLKLETHLCRHERLGTHSSCLLLLRLQASSFTLFKLEAQDLEASRFSIEALAEKPNDNSLKLQQQLEVQELQAQERGAHEAEELGAKKSLNLRALSKKIFFFFFFAAKRNQAHFLFRGGGVVSWLLRRGTVYTSTTNNNYCV